MGTKKGPMPEKQKEHLRKVWRDKKTLGSEKDPPPTLSPFLEPNVPLGNVLHMPYTVTFKTHSGEQL